MTLVDKSHGALLDNMYVEKRFAVIRRPSGFGKTTFLSMVEAFYDIDIKGGYMFPLGTRSHCLPSDLRAELLVLHLDFDSIEVDFSTALEEEISAACTAYWIRQCKHMRDDYHDILATTRARRLYNHTHYWTDDLDLDVLNLVVRSLNLPKDHL